MTATSVPSHRSNNFDALRLAGALAVVFGHSYHLLGIPQYNPGIFGYSLQTFGVVVFFSISGYLITASWNRTRNVAAYFSARCLRIFPALIVVVVLAALVIGPLVTTLPLGEYFQDPSTRTYVTSNLAMKPQYNLAGVWADLPYPNAVNGSLWTLPAEFFCYLVVPLAMIFPRLLRPVVVIALTLVSLWLMTTPPEQGQVIWGNPIIACAGMWVFFGAGSFLRLMHERWRGVFRGDVATVLTLGYMVLMPMYPVWALRLSFLVLPYAVLTIGLASSPYLRRAARFGDLSYGCYLWAFPVQQLVIQGVGVQNVWVNFVMVAGISLALAWVSWHVIESPSLKLKDRVAARFSRRVPQPRPA